MELIEFTDGHPPIKISAAHGYAIIITQSLRIGGTPHDYLIVHRDRVVYMTARYLQSFIHHRLIEGDA